MLKRFLFSPPAHSLFLPTTRQAGNPHSCVYSCQSNAAESAKTPLAVRLEKLLQKGFRHLLQSNMCSDPGWGYCSLWWERQQDECHTSTCFLMLRNLPTKLSCISIIVKETTYSPYSPSQNSLVCYRSYTGKKKNKPWSTSFMHFPAISKHHFFISSWTNQLFAEQ